MEIRKTTTKKLMFEDTDGSVFNQVEKNYEDAQQDLIVFVERQIDLMNSNLLFAGQDIPSFYALNKSLCEFESILLGLIAIHNNLRIEHELAKERYDDFYAQKFVDEKTAQASLGKQSQFTSTKEIDMFVRQKYLVNLSKLKADCIKIENKYNFINHLITAWNSYQFVLGNISKNAQAEVSASGIAVKNQTDYEAE